MGITRHIVTLLIILPLVLFGQSTEVKEREREAIFKQGNERVQYFQTGFNNVQMFIETNLINAGLSNETAAKKAMDSTRLLSREFNKYSSQYFDLMMKDPKLKMARRKYVDSLATLKGIQYFTVAFDTLFENNLKKLEAIRKGNK